ncbi:MAG: MarR family winged helix-turn-helix transcriptional regulator [Nanoarchaeota archaeon]|nr:MarR family winged helix-turn-helix transcriptional regulator [Nanoarchaeota archaeon]
MNISIETIAKNVSSPGWEILLLLSENEYLPHMEIKNITKLNQMKAQVEIARLEGAVLIKSVRSEEDRRSINYSITDYGLEVLKRKKG